MRMDALADTSPEVRFGVRAIGIIIIGQLP